MMEKILEKLEDTQKQEKFKLPDFKKKTDSDGDIKKSPVKQENFNYKDSSLQLRESIKSKIPNFKNYENKKYNMDNKLESNTTFTDEKGYTYTTDSQSRVVKVEGQLVLKKEHGRESMPSKHLPDQKPTDDKGHIIGDRFDGSNELYNLLPQDANVNRGEYKRLENDWHKALTEGKEVKVKIEPRFENDSKRPTEYRISYSIDGEKYRTTIKNESNKKETA